MGNLNNDVVFDSIYLFTDPNDRRWRLPSWPPPFSARCPSSFAPFYFADAAGIDGVAAVFTRLAPFKRGALRGESLF
jgi:hypothetical protein